jgi:phospholipid transport system substrate-binding protein
LGHTGLQRAARRRASAVACAASLALVAQLAAAPRGLADPAPAPDPAAATKLVEDLHDIMLGVMKEGEKLGYPGRLARLEPAIASRYDFAFMAEKSVGLAWKDLDEAQRKQLVDAMERLAGATYANRMKDFSGERFETLGTQAAAQSTMLVRTQIVEGDGKKTTLDYRVRALPDGSPRIVDVFFDGTVSELAMRRSEYSALLKKGGFPTLMEALEKKIAEQAQAATG